MKTNLETFPKCQNQSKFYKWKENFTKELKTIKQDAKDKKLPSIYCLGYQRLAEEILGETPT